MSDDWSQATSETYRALSQIAVPARAEQLATMLTLIPFDADDEFHIVELASGEGFWSAAILQAFPNATVLALDYEQSMREVTGNRIAAFGERGSVDSFDILQTDWFDKLDSADVVVSSLCVHHLEAEGKQQLFQAVAERTSANGTLIIADLVQPQTPQATELFGKTWDSFAESQSIGQTMQRELFELFQREEWNIYWYPDPFDKPDPLYKQLQWLDAAGFAVVDSFWMQAGHAVYGGYKSQRDAGIPFGDALQIAQKVLT